MSMHAQAEEGSAHTAQESLEAMLSSLHQQLDTYEVEAAGTELDMKRCADAADLGILWSTHLSASVDNTVKSTHCGCTKSLSSCPARCGLAALSGDTRLACFMSALC